MKFVTVQLLGLLFAWQSFAQSATVTGYIRDAENGENLIGATVYNIRRQSGTSSNAYGFYSITTTGDSVILHYSYVGYQSLRLRISAKDTVLNVRLSPINRLQEVVIEGDKVDKIHESSSMSTLHIPVTQVKAMPTLMGEADVIKVLQLLPGVQSGNEGTSGLYVRGGGADQNLILLDGVPLYNPSHLYGFFSTFNADAINHVELVKGGFPARYGGRLSSVVDISMKEGNQKKLSAQATVGVVSSKFVLEGPVSKKISFIVSARRSYLNLLKSSTLAKQTQGISDDYYFYDLNAKINYRIGEKDRIYLSGYLGNDKANSGSSQAFSDNKIKYSSESSSQLRWGNAVAALRWNHVFNKKLFSTTSATYSRYQFDTFTDKSSRSEELPSGQVKNQHYKYQYQSGINDFAGRVDFDFIPGPSHYIRFGANAIHHQFTRGVLAIRSTEAITSGEWESNEVDANEFSGYVEDDWQLSSKLKVNAGVHSAAFLVDGKTYSSVQPRLSFRYLLADNLALKGSYANMVQFVHLLTNAGIGLPTDLWVPSTGKIEPQGSNQWALGLAETFNDEYEISVEAYYKSMSKVIEYKDGASYLNVDQNWQEKVDVGRGESYGSEFFLHKKQGKFNGWIGYTLSWTNRQFDNINDGKWFPYRYDRRHDAKIALSYTLSEKWNLGLSWVYGTGNAVTLPLEAYRIGMTAIMLDPYNLVSIYENQYIEHFGSRNNFRMRDYHRLDLNASYSFQTKKLSHQLICSVYNAYNRKNPFYLEFGSDITGKILIQKSLFAVLPSLSYSIKI